MNKYYEPGKARGERVNVLFSRIAPRYNLLNDVQSFGLHRLWKRRLVRMAGPNPGERALDVCCGTGDIALELAKNGMEVVGVDFSKEMLEIAERRGRKAHLQKKAAPASGAAWSETTFTPSDGEHGSIRVRQKGWVEFVTGDAQVLPFPDGSFDVVSVGYGLRNLADWKLGLREMWRVALPEGRLLVLDFAKPDSAVWRWVYFLYLRCVVPVFGKLFCGDAEAYSYILESLKHYPAQSGVAEEMRALGCKEVRVVNLLGGVMSINFGRKKDPVEKA